MGKSSPTGLQLKHLPDLVVLQTVYCLQSQWTVWVGGRGEVKGVYYPTSPMRQLSFRQKRTAAFYEISEALRPIPEKLILRKLQHLENRGLIEGYGPSGLHFRVVDVEESTGH